MGTSLENTVSLVALAVSYSTFIVLSVLFPEIAPEIHQIAGITHTLNVHKLFLEFLRFNEPGQTEDLWAKKVKPNGLKMTLALCVELQIFRDRVCGLSRGYIVEKRG